MCKKIDIGPVWLKLKASQCYFILSVTHRILTVTLHICKLIVPMNLTDGHRHGKVITELTTVHFVLYKLVFCGLLIIPENQNQTLLISDVCHVTDSCRTKGKQYNNRTEAVNKCLIYLPTLYDMNAYIHTQRYLDFFFSSNGFLQIEKEHRSILGKKS